MKEEALKLAERLDLMNRNMPPPEVIEASAMIRRLVEELDRNKIYIQKMEDALGCDVSYYEPLNKPVNPFAWIDPNDNMSDPFSWNKTSYHTVPLYTTPQIKELSDEEIKAIANNLTCTPDKNWNVLFAKAILKKASEK